MLRLRELLDVTRASDTHFVAAAPDAGLARIFGGELLGQALVAAGRTVDAMPPHSCHARFLRPADTRDAVEFDVATVRDGRSFSHREVVATQRGAEILRMTASFHAYEDGLEHATPMPDVPEPETLPPFREVVEPFADSLTTWFRRPRPVEVRYVGDAPWMAAEGEARPTEARVWMRAESLRTSDMLMHAAALLYASDMTILDAANLRHGLGWNPQRIRAATLDHAMWFHALRPADDWFLYDQACPWTGAGRALATGAMHARDGVRLASVVQEGVFRTPL